MHMMMNSGSQITMADHIAELNQLFFFHLRWLRTVKQSLMLDTTKTLVQCTCFVSSSMDGCNCLLAGVSSQVLQKS